MSLRVTSARVLSALALAGSLGLALPQAANADAASTGSPITPTAVSSYDSKITNDGTNVYYPTNVSGTLPVALLLQGAKVHRQYYSEYARAIASYGFIVVTPNHKRLNFVDLNYYTSTAQIGETLAWMASENTNASSPLAGHIDTNSMVLLGHSFGGATGLSIAESKCSIPFCTGLTFTLPSAVKAASFYGTNNAILGIYPSIDNKIPVQLVQGQSDGMAEPAQAETTYTKIANGHKQIVRVTGANHYGITNVQSPSGAEAEVNTQASTQAASIETTSRWAALWLKAQLGNTAAASYVYTTGDAADTDVTVTSAP